MAVDLDQFRARLKILRTTLLADRQAGQEATRTVELDQAKVGRLSRMDAMQAQAMSQESSRRRDRQIIQIDAALKRIEQDEFGYCLDCGEPITIGRLEISPTALHCIRCAGNHES